MTYPPDPGVQGVALIGTEVRSRSDGWTAVRDVGATGMHGVGWLCHFSAGRVHRLTVRIRAGQRTAFRIELHGSATRYQRCFCDLELNEGIVRPAEEIRTASVRDTGDGGCEVTCTFVPHVSTVTWFYLLARCGERVSAAPCEGTAFQYGSLALSATTERAEGFRLLRYNKAIDIGPDLIFALQSYLLLRNYFHLEFEIWAGAARQPAQVEILSKRAIGSATWIASGQKRRLTVPAVLGRRQSAEGFPLSPVATDRQLPSPALCDRFGPDYAYRGHAIWGLFADWTDVNLETTDTSAGAVELSLGFRFDDGLERTVQLDAQTLRRLALPDQPTVVDRFWQLVDAAPGGQFLEVGGRGSVATLNRERLGGQWSYTSIDFLAGPNVDVVGDAHALSQHFEQESFDALYADQLLEHLLAPWRFVVEANRVLKTGALICLSTPSALPLHSEPWDFYRFSDHCWPALLNSLTGFEIVDRSITTPVVMLSRIAQPSLERMQCDPTFMMTSVLARKVGNTVADWSGYDLGLAFGIYPRDR